MIMLLSETEGRTARVLSLENSEISAPIIIFMNITKRDVQELRRRLKKKERTFTRLCGCYVNSAKQILTQFSIPFSEMSEEEFLNYIEIARKVLSGALGSNLLELSFAQGEYSDRRRDDLLSLSRSGLQEESQLESLYRQIISDYENPGNYLILLYHDVYDVPTRTKDENILEDSEEVYRYLLCALCPVDLSRSELGYHEDENRIGVCPRDWVVGQPELGFLYPAFIDHSGDVNAVMYYVKTGKYSHPEFAEKILGCVPQRTGAEDKQTFQDIIIDAFNGEDEKADTALLLLQNAMSGIVAEQQEDESSPPLHLTGEVLTDLAAEIDFIPEPARNRMEQACTEVFGETPPTLSAVFDSKLASKGAQRANTIRLERQITDLTEQLAAKIEDDTPPWVEDTDVSIALHVPEDRMEQIHTETVQGQPFLLIPFTEGETVNINGVNRQL